MNEIERAEALGKFCSNPITVMTAAIAFIIIGIFFLILFEKDIRVRADMREIKKRFKIALAKKDEQIEELKAEKLDLGADKVVLMVENSDLKHEVTWLNYKLSQLEKGKKNADEQASG